MIRLILLIFFFLLSLLAVFKAPAYYIWLTAIVVTEYPLILVAITALITLSGIWIAPYRLTGNIIGIVTIVIYLSPVVRAYWVSKDVNEDMKRAFANASLPVNKSPFSFLSLFKATHPVAFKTVTYAQYPGVSLTMDYYGNTFSAKQPCVIMVHGGSWSSGDSQQLPDLNWYLAGKGYQVASINYRMAPKYQTPAPVEDIENAIKYLSAHAVELNIDTTKFVLLGRSAGAQIALLAAYTLQNPHIKGVIDFYGPADMVWGYSIPSNPLIMDSRKVMRNYIGGTYEVVPQKFKACSPLEFVNRQSVPTLIIHGENDVLVSREHSRRLDLRLEEYGIPHYWLKLPWATHGFDFNLNGPGGQLSTYAVETFLYTVTQ
ncbi:alpha/beta hydrolase [Mucilaginibacter sp. HMF5004]|uniref:alpha/beta hydrolase n=1 Tax=Mucilaginibacter rivuli TaxID=2857527 RepID=UPI001C5ED0A8|nr:alpha/beta hydrolase [Mucilaginibacter rivuli]MBW4890659.1 alpha/beta hydrolase [Mucilaginibacter rivuli]